MKGDVNKIRIASVQWLAGMLTGKEQFYDRVAYHVRAAADYDSDFVVFPELFTLCLLSAEEPVGRADVARRLNRHTSEFVERLNALAKTHGINIVGGSHLRIDEGGTARNTCYVFLRDGSIHAP